MSNNNMQPKTTGLVYKQDSLLKIHFQPLRKRPNHFIYPRVCIACLTSVMSTDMKHLKWRNSDDHCQLIVSYHKPTFTLHPCLWIPQLLTHTHTYTYTHEHTNTHRQTDTLTHTWIYSYLQKQWIFIFSQLFACHTSKRITIQHCYLYKHMHTTSMMCLFNILSTLTNQKRYL